MVVIGFQERHRVEIQTVEFSKGPGLSNKKAMLQKSSEFSVRSIRTWSLIRLLDKVAVFAFSELFRRAVCPCRASTNNLGAEKLNLSPVPGKCTMELVLGYL